MKKPIRMCIICRGRFEQNTLIRFQQNSRKLIEFSKEGRSSYMCLACLSLDDKKLVKILNGKYKLKYKKLDEFGSYILSNKEKYSDG